jgi:hypothetical protein
MSDVSTHLEVDRADHGQTRLVEETLQPLAEDSVRFHIERFALTANNITYAAFGDALGYWDFFPATDGFGRVPAMGFAQVVESTHPEVHVGGRYYGWYPMSSHIDVVVSRTGEGLRDDGEHRAKHAAVYRSYSATDRDPLYEVGEDAECRHALLRGLFMTGYLADDFLADQQYHGAERAVVISASSKTAISFAQRASLRGLGEVVGLTSARNLGFVEGLGFYDRVVAYEDLESIPADGDVVTIDMAGNGEVALRLDHHLGTRIRYAMSIGKSHHDAPAQTSDLKGASPEMFFAPSQVAKRISDWGREGYQQRVGDAVREFVAASRDWLTLHHASGPAEAQATWTEVHDGKIPPNVGPIVRLG